MRQTRRSRSTAATPQKDESANQVEEVIQEEKSVKTNLETVFEKEAGDKQAEEEIGAASEQAGTEEAEVPEVQEEEEIQEAQPDDVGAPSAENDTPTEENASEPAAETEKTSDVPPKGEASPRKQDTGVIELNCQVCNCSFTNYHEHMNSESHKAKISHSTAKTENQTNVEKTNTPGQAQKRSGDQDGTPSAKRMKNQNTPNAVEKFYCDICKLTILKQQDYDHHMQGKRHMLNVTRAQGKSYCEICKLFFNTVTDLNDHNESQMHKKNVSERKQDKQMFECKLCAVSLCGQKQYDQHLTSKRHKRLSENPNAAVANKTPVNGKVEMKTNESEKKWLYLCNACNFGSNQDQQFCLHMNLAAHKANVIDMKKKGLLLEKEVSKPAVSKPAGFKPTGVNTAQNVRRFPQGNTGPRAFAASSGPMNKPAPKANVNANSAGPVTSVTYNIVSGPNAVTNAMSKPAPIKKDGPQPARKGPAPGPSGPKKNIPPTKPMGTLNKPPLSGRPNTRFPGKPVENVPNKFMPIPQPMKLGFQNACGNFGPAFGAHTQEPNVGGNFGSYRPGNFGIMRNDVSTSSDIRNDFRGNARDDYRPDVRDLRDIRDVRAVNMSGDNRADTAFRAGYYRESPVDSGRDARDFGGNYRGGDMAVEARSDVRPSMSTDTRGDMRGMVRNDMSRDMGGDLRGYANNDMRDLRNDSRSDYIRDRSTLSAYGGSAAFGQSYRGNDEYRSDNYGRGAQSSGSATTAGNYSSGMVGSGRYDNYMDRNTSVYSNQYSGSSRGIGYMGDMSLNGR